MQALAHPCVFPIALRGLVALFPLFGVYDGFIWRLLRDFFETLSKTPFGRPPETDFEDFGITLTIRWQFVWS